jgi:transcriptional regulator with XRE-family HTH domain
MADQSVNPNGLLNRQMTLFRLAERDHGFSQQLLSAETGICTTSLSEYATGKTKLSLSALLKIASIPHFPASLLSILFEGTGRCVVNQGTDDGDHDTLAENCNAFASKTARARHPGSPGGIEIVPVEDRELRACRAQLKVAA